MGLDGDGNVNDDMMEQAKARMQEALRQTQEQTEDAAVQLGALFRKGAQKLKEASDAATEAIRKDFENRR
jgi:hypothetical protein